jgi:hypothetical protein
MPFLDPMVGPQFHDGLWLQYPLCSRTLPAHYAHAIKARSDLRQMLADIMHKIRNRSESDGPTSFETVQDFKDRLDTWLQNLPPSMTSKNIVFLAQSKPQSEASLLSLHNEFNISSLVLVPSGNEEPLLGPQSQSNSGHEEAGSWSMRGSQCRGRSWL